MTTNLRAKMDVIRGTLAERVQDLEVWRGIMSDMLEDATDDVIKLEERCDEMDLRADEHALRVVRLELAMGIAIEEKQLEG